MAQTFKARVKAPDWSKVADTLVTLQAIKAVGDDLAEDITSRVRRGIGSDGTPLPDHYVRERRPQDPLPKGKKGSKSNPSKLPVSVINQIRVLGGHIEKPAAGTTWQGYDHVIRYGADTRPGQHEGHRPGDIYAYQWDSAEKFRKANYGSEPGVRKGVMLRDMAVKVKQGRDHWFLTVGPKGKSARKLPMFRLLQMSKQRNAAAQEGRKPRKFASSFRMALLERLGRDGKLASSESQAIGVLDPSSRTLSETLQRRLAEPFLRRLSQAPIREVKP